MTNLRKKHQLLGTLVSSFKSTPIEISLSQYKSTPLSQDGASALIESLLMWVPLPQIILDSNGNVIIGHKYLSALYDYFNDKYCISSAKSIGNIDGLIFSELSHDISRKLEGICVDYRVLELDTNSYDNNKIELVKLLQKIS